MYAQNNNNILCHIITGNCPTRDIRLTFDNPVEIFSPCFPEMYPIDTRCTWYITSEQPDTVVIEFTQFQLEQDFDFLTVGEGRNVTDVSKIVGSTGNWAPSKIIILNAESIWMTFLSDILFPDLGFGLLISLKATLGRFEYVALQESL